jgi:hypothetical protein
MIPESPGRLVRLNRSIVSRGCSLAFALLIVLPLTEPFQTVSLSELLASVVHAGAAAATAPIVVATKDTGVSVVPPTDQTEGRLKVESRSTAEKWKSPDCHRSIFQTPLLQNAERADQSATVLRL